MTGPSTEPLSPEDGGPITEPPDLKRVNGFTRMLARVWTQKSLKPLRDYIFVPAYAPAGFAEKSLETLAAELKTNDENVAKAILAEAEAIFQEPIDRIEGAERRATTLQGAVAIAASIVIAGAGLLLDPAKVRGQGWRVAFGAMLLAFVLCLTACAIRAVGATSRIFSFVQPGPQRIGDRARMDNCSVVTHRAAELLRASEVANQVGRVKVGLLRSAAWWFRAAILTLALLAGTTAAYTIAEPQPAAQGTAKTTTVVVRLPTAPGGQPRSWRRRGP